MTGEPAKARPANVDVSVSPRNGTITVAVYEGMDDYVILSASRDASDSMIDAAAKIAKEIDQ